MNFDMNVEVGSLTEPLVAERTLQRSFLEVNSLSMYFEWPFTSKAFGAHVTLERLAF